jgi:hypothetical protein
VGWVLRPPLEGAHWKESVPALVHTTPNWPSSLY